MGLKFMSWIRESFVSWICVKGLQRLFHMNSRHEFETETFSYQWPSFSPQMTRIADSQLFAIILNIENHGIHGYGSLTWMPINWPINFSLIQLSEVHSMRTKPRTPLFEEKTKETALRWNEVPQKLRKLQKKYPRSRRKGLAHSFGC